MSVLLSAAGCSALQQPPAPADTVTRNLNEMKAAQDKAPAKVDERDARIAALERQLADRDAELARLRTLAAERDRLAGQVTASSNDLDDARRRLEEATRKIDALNGDVAERDGQIARLTALMDKGQGTADELSRARQQLFTLQGAVNERDQEIARLAPILKEHEQEHEELDRLRQEVARLRPIEKEHDLEHPELDRMKLQVASLTGSVNDRDQEIASLKGLLASQPPPAMVKAEKDLVKALQPEIRAGNVIVGQSGDKLTINLASTLLFDSGQDALKPAGVDVLKRVGGVLREFPEKAVHVAGYTDNVPIRSALKKKFPTNKELSDARATNAANLLEASGVPKETISAAGHGESQPVADNKTEEGRKKNRRVEIVVSAKQ
jgi:chemotaxis protein MotB